VIFPAHCKEVGVANETPLGGKVYFLSRYLLRAVGESFEVIAVDLAQDETALMRSLRSSRVLATPDEVTVCPDRVNLHNRVDLIRRALASGTRCTVFTGHDEHRTFVLDPDEAEILIVHVYDIMPPRPNLSGYLKELDATGLFGELEIEFAHHIRDIREIGADLYPCRAAGFPRTIDADRPQEGDHIAGCLTGRQILHENYGNGFFVEEICPLQAAEQEPFIARCCRSERAGLGEWNGKFGVVVHWGASPHEIAKALFALIAAWRERT
jgi:hypothetical protein